MEPITLADFGHDERIVLKRRIDAARRQQWASITAPTRIVTNNGFEQQCFRMQKEQPLPTLADYEQRL